MVASPGWQEVFQPWLEGKIRNSWIDPRSFKNDDEYVYAMKTAWAWASAAEEVLAFVTKMQEESEQMTIKEQKYENIIKEGGDTL